MLLMGRTHLQRSSDFAHKRAKGAGLMSQITRAALTPDTRSASANLTPAHSQPSAKALRAVGSEICAFSRWKSSVGRAASPNKAYLRHPKTHSNSRRDRGDIHRQHCPCGYLVLPPLPAPPSSAVQRARRASALPLQGPLLTLLGCIDTLYLKAAHAIADQYSRWRCPLRCAQPLFLESRSFLVD